MPARRHPAELNTDSPRGAGTQAMVEYLVTAANALFLYEQAVERARTTATPSLLRAHATIRAEIRRLRAAQSGDPLPAPGGRPAPSESGER